MHRAEEPGGDGRACIQVLTPHCHSSSGPQTGKWLGTAPSTGPWGTRRRKTQPDLATCCGPASKLVCQVTLPPGACTSLSFPGPRPSALVQAPGARHGAQKVSAGLLRHECRVGENTAPGDSRPPHQSMTEGSSWPGGLAQDVHPQPRSPWTSHATHAHAGIPTDLQRAHAGIPTDLPTLCHARADSEVVAFTFPRRRQECTDHTPLHPTCKEDTLALGQGHALRLLR